LVSGQVTNWVLRDTLGRLRLNVGVAYGSDVDKVRDLLEKAACEHPEVITDGKAPAPNALFMGFGDSSLDFELRARIYRIDRRFSVTSDLNFAIDRAFRDAGITIPFPQRDLHVVSLPKDDTEKTKQIEQATPAAADPALARAAPQPESVTRIYKRDVDLAASAEDVWEPMANSPRESAAGSR
jgi:small-conductance mechanosensitive channel